MRYWASVNSRPHLVQIFYCAMSVINTSRVWKDESENRSKSAFDPAPCLRHNLHQLYPSSSNSEAPNGSKFWVTKANTKDIQTQHSETEHLTLHPKRRYWLPPSKQKHEPAASEGSGHPTHSATTLRHQFCERRNCWGQ